MTRIIDSTLFSDIDLKFKVHPITNDVPLLRNVEAIKRSIRNLVLSNRFDKPYSSSIYGGILNALFENYDPILVLELKDRISTVLQYEPRAQDIIIEVNEEVSTIDRNGINISIKFRPVNTKDITATVNVFLERLR